MSDSAKGSVAGFLFQYERAILLMTNLSSPSDYITIEDVDDVAAHQENGTVLIADQSKNSISQSGTTFEDSSYALWRTFELWILKYQEGIFNLKTKFICSTNKEIPKDSLLFSISKEEFPVIKDKILKLKKRQEQKLLESKNGTSIKTTLRIIKFVIKNFEDFSNIQPNIEIQDKTNYKEELYNRLLLNTQKFTKLQKENVYEGLLGWLTSHSLNKWRNGSIAKFKKSELDNKYQSLLGSPSIVKAIFRVKRSVDISYAEMKANEEEVFVKQLNKLATRKDLKERMIKRAIEDFIRYEIEHTYMITEIGEFTQEDFLDFLNQCYEQWQNCFDDKVRHDLSEYSEKEKNEIGLDIYNYTINVLKLNFKNDFFLVPDNEYIKNGSFLKLSNIPEIGWHPDWEKEFKKS